MIQFKRGATFEFTGQLTSKGVPYPLTGCTLYADIRSHPNFAFVQHLNVSVLDVLTARIRLYAAPADTLKWLAMPHLIDLRLVKNDTGKVLISNTIEFYVLDTVTEVA